MNCGDGQIQGYTFDEMGNRTGKTDSLNPNETYVSNAANMTTSRNGQPYTYDANGNTLTGGGRTNVWDSQNRMYSCTYAGNTNAFTYGSDGLRRASVTNNTRTDFAIDGQTVVREMRDIDSDGDLDPIATYFNGMYKRDDTNGTLRWYIYDGLGSVLAEVDPSGNVTAGRKYDVYGLVRSGQAGISKHKFVGQLGHVSEDETGLIYMRARYMDPVLGKFVSEDPARDGGNWFVYCENNPVNLVDTDGFFWSIVATVVVTIIAVYLAYEAIMYIVNTIEGLILTRQAIDDAFNARESSDAANTGRRFNDCSDSLIEAVKKWAEVVFGTYAEAPEVP